MPVSSLISTGMRSCGSLNDEICDSRNPVIWQILEFHHPQLDDFVLRCIQAGGLDIQQNASLCCLPVAWGEFCPRSEPTKDSAVRRLR
jgi:hypothetical protein